ncbi:TPA: hypothetical protein U5D21_002771 [Yersinia enterocolitica]|nr:hypothetical protein [Yersinia enterocolitica]
MKVAVRQTMGYFNNYFRYSLERLAADYDNEIRQYRDDRWEAPQRAARLSAAVKNYKTSQMLSFIFGIALENGLDLTPLVVKRLCHSLFGRKGSQSHIVAIFGVKHRVRRSEHSSQDTIEVFALRYRLAAYNYWSATLADIEKVKFGYSEKIRDIKKKKVSK